MKFAKFTNTQNKEPVWVNLDHISSVHLSDKPEVGPRKVLIITIRGDFWYVDDSLEDVIEEISRWRKAADYSVI